MTETKCLDFLKQIFFQSYLNENFYHSCLKLRIDFNHWPEYPALSIAKKFFNTAKDKSYNSALIEINFNVPENAYKEIISEEEIKIFYADYLNYLRALELVKKLKTKPEEAISICTEFLDKKISTAKKINLQQAIGSFVEENEKKLLSGSNNVLLKEFPALSETVGGFNPGRVSIITAYTGFGKTNFGVNFLRAALNDKRNSIYINMEMDTTDMTKRFLQSFCRLRSRDFEKNDYIGKIALIGNIEDSLSKSWITDGSAMSISEISQMVSETKRNQVLDFVIVDYDQKIIVESNLREEWQYVKKAVEMLEALAKKENVHIVLFAQTNEESAGAPIASRRSMQPASSVIQFSKDGEKIVLKFIKNRHGATNNKIELNYDPSLSLITEIGYVSDPLPAPVINKRRDIYG